MASNAQKRHELQQENGGERGVSEHRLPQKSTCFSKFSCSSPSPALYKVQTGKKKLWKQASNVVCGMRGGGGYV